MDRTTINGQQFYRKVGLIEALGNSTSTEGYSRFGSITFEDGEVLTAVNVDTTLTALVATPRKMTFLFLRIRRQWMLIAVEDDGVLRVSAFTHYMFGAVFLFFVVAFFAGLGLFLLLAATVTGVFGLMFAALALGLAVFHGMGAMGLIRAKRAADTLRLRPRANALLADI